MPLDWSKCLSNGVPVQSGAPLPQRKDISTLSDAELFLYVEGLRRLQLEPIKENLSYYRLAGIHGQPRELWPQDDTDIPVFDKNRLFCTHSSILFLTWHRPYLATFEAALYNHVNSVVDDLANPNEKTSPDQKTYKELAQSFRIPYWDWAYGASVGQLQHYPAVAKNKTYPVGTCPAWKNDSLKDKYPTKSTDPNPLFSWKFPPNVDDSVKYETYDGTVRFPNSQAAADTWAELDSLDGGGKENGITYPRKNFSERVGYLLQSYARYGGMSSNRFQDGKSPQGHPELYGSLEDIHNSIHDATGGGGHMSDPAIAAFDPVFWLHHANIDRLMAIWEAVHQDDKKVETWVQKTDKQPPTWAIKGGTLGPDTPLYPFRRTTKNVGAGSEKAASDFFTSNDTKGTKQFGYTYPELADLKLPLSDPDRLKLGVSMASLYATADKSLRMSMRKDKTAGQDMLLSSAVVKQFTESDIPATTAQMISVLPTLPDQDALLQASNAPEKPVLRDLVSNNKYQEWLIDVKAEKHSLGGAYSVHFFLGDVQENNVYLWPLSPYHVGSFVPFGQPQNTGCEQCSQDQRDHLQITGQIPLTIALMERYLAQIIPNMDEATVVDFLTKNLHWRVEVNGQSLDDRSQVAGLQVFVVTNEVTLPEDDSQLPTYADEVVIHPEITTNRNGGGRGEGTGLTSGGM